MKYGMMAAIGEVFEVLEKSEFDLDYEMHFLKILNKC
jgi:6-phosphogluconate dehydrogenase (decarboxylating)